MHGGRERYFGIEFTHMKTEYRIAAVLGSIPIGVAVPTLLVFWHTRFLTGGTLAGGTAQIRSIGEILMNGAGIEAMATIFCGPGALVLALILFAILDRYTPPTPGDAGGFMTRGMVLGAILAFANFPGYLVMALLDMSVPDEVVRLVLLFAVTGASCGSWIGWQVHRSRVENAPFFPQFSLKMLLGFVLAWGTVMAIMRPV